MVPHIGVFLRKYYSRYQGTTNGMRTALWLKNMFKDHPAAPDCDIDISSESGSYLLLQWYMAVMKVVRIISR